LAVILLVDDDHDVLILGKSIFAQAGYHVMTADNALSALQILNDWPCDVVLTDANMPQHSGFDLIRTIRAQEKWDAIAVAMLTSRRERRDIERAVELGADDYIIKPIDPMLMLKKVETLLQKHQGQAAYDEFDFATANLVSKGTLQIGIELKSISEIGIVVITSHKLSDSSVVEVTHPLFVEAGVTPPPVRVISSVSRNQNQEFESRLMFVGADEAFLQKIRSWIYTHASKASRKPA